MNLEDLRPKLGSDFLDFMAQCEDLEEMTAGKFLDFLLDNHKAVDPHFMGTWQDLMVRLSTVRPYAAYANIQLEKIAQQSVPFVESFEVDQMLLQSEQEPYGPYGLQPSAHEPPEQEQELSEDEQGRRTQIRHEIYEVWAALREVLLQLISDRTNQFLSALPVDDREAVARTLSSVPQFPSFRKHGSDQVSKTLAAILRRTTFNNFHQYVSGAKLSGKLPLLDAKVYNVVDFVCSEVVLPKARLDSEAECIAYWRGVLRRVAGSDDCSFIIRSGELMSLATKEQCQKQKAEYPHMDCLTGAGRNTDILFVCVKEEFVRELGIMEGKNTQASSSKMITQNRINTLHGRSLLEHHKCLRTTDPDLSAYCGDVK
ncbi:hypothetical protein DFQ27_000175, partial [Actinomortierella ambigua]